jgi:hypothetical protein
MMAFCASDGQADCSLHATGISKVRHKAVG